MDLRAISSALTLELTKVVRRYQGKGRAHKGA